MTVEFVGATRLEAATVLERCQLIGIGQHFGRVMRDMDRREMMFLLEFPEQSAQLTSQWRIQVGKGLVQEQQTRAVDQCAPEGCAAGFSA